MSSRRGSQAAGLPQRPRGQALRAAPAEQLHWVSWLRVLAICGVVTIHATAATAVRPDASSTGVGGSPVASTVLELVGRTGGVVVVTFLFVLLLRRIPLVQRVV